MSLDKCFSLQTRGDAAASQLVLYHYPELKEEKGIVLMTAEMDPTFLVRINFYLLSGKILETYRYLFLKVDNNFVLHKLFQVEVSTITNSITYSQF